MAVSNAIGSNVFDINLGLGLPFLIGTLARQKPIHLLTPIQEVYDVFTFRFLLQARIMLQNPRKNYSYRFSSNCISKIFVKMNI